MVLFNSTENRLNRATARKITNVTANVTAGVVVGDAVGAALGDTGAAKPDFTISASAENYLMGLPEIKAGKNFRILVEGGGCSGFSYVFSFDDTIAKADRLFQRGGVAVVIDEISLPYLLHGELDYVEKLMGSYLTVHNPNAKSGCGCGSSFSI